jgi:hypothetical protein
MRDETISKIESQLKETIKNIREEEDQNKIHQSFERYLVLNRRYYIMTGRHYPSKLKDLCEDIARLDYGR